MEKIINTPGLQHLAESIYLNLDYAALKKCQFINQSTSKILSNPMFWFEELIRYVNRDVNTCSNEDPCDLIATIQMAKNFEKKLFRRMLDMFWDLPLLGDDELLQTIIHYHQYRQTKLKLC